MNWLKECSRHRKNGKVAGGGPQSRTVLITYCCDQRPDEKPLKGGGVDFAPGIKKGDSPSWQPTKCEADDHILAVRKQSHPLETKCLDTRA